MKHNRVRNDWRTSIGIVERGAINQIKNNMNDEIIETQMSSIENEAIIKEVPPVVKVTADYKSNEYKNKLNYLGFTKIQTNAIYKGVKRIFNNKKSESREGFYAIDLNNPKKKFYNGDGEVDSVRRPNELLKYITENEKANIITIHNHRGDSYPSINDLYANSSVGTNKFIVVGNNGAIFCCDCSKANRELIKIDFKKHNTYNEDEFKEFCKKVNVKFKIL